MITSHDDVLEPLKQVLSASLDVIISGQIRGSKLQRVFTSGDGCWLPIKASSLIFLRSHQELNCVVSSETVLSKQYSAHLLN